MRWRRAGWGSGVDGSQGREEGGGRGGEVMVDM